MYDSLRRIGLTEQEIDFYAVALAMGPSKISTMAERLEISRPSAYKAVLGLVARGLGVFMPGKKHFRVFTIESPTVIFDKLKEQSARGEQLARQLDAAIPEMLQEYRRRIPQSRIRLFEGKATLKQLHGQMLEEAQGAVRLCGSRVPFLAFLSTSDMRDWGRRRLQRGVQNLQLVIHGVEGEPPIPDEEEDMKGLKEFHVLKGMSPFPATAFQLFDKKVIFWQARAAVLMEDEHFAGMMNIFFRHFWAESEKVAA